VREDEMPAPSKAMRRLAGLAEHHPSKVSAKNKSILGMTHQQLHDFASTPEKGLPEHTKKSGFHRLKH
jgi:hypothetical protein